MSGGKCSGDRGFEIATSPSAPRNDKAGGTDCHVGPVGPPRNDKKKGSKKKAAVVRVPLADRRRTFDLAVFAQRIELLRTEQGMSKRRFALFVGTSSSVVSWWDKGRNSPSVYMIFQIARAFDVSADWLLGLTDERKKIYEP